MASTNHTHMWSDLNTLFPEGKATLETLWLILWKHHLSAHRPKGKQQGRSDEGIRRERVTHFNAWASCPLQTVAIIALKNGNYSAWHEMPWSTFASSYHMVVFEAAGTYLFAIQQKIGQRWSIGWQSVVFSVSERKYLHCLMLRNWLCATKTMDVIVHASRIHLQADQKDI